MKPEALMQLAVEEWDRIQTWSGKNSSKNNQNPTNMTDSNIAAVALSSEKPAANAGRGRGHGRWRGRGRGRGRNGQQNNGQSSHENAQAGPVANKDNVCWNCGGCGHRKNMCSTPSKNDSGSQDQSKQQQGNNSQKPASVNPLSSSSPGASMAILEEGVHGAWSAVVIGDLELEFEDYLGLEEIEEADNVGQLSMEIKETHFDISDGVPEDILTLMTEEMPNIIPVAAHALVSSLLMNGDCAWDLYDSGASHHTSGNLGSSFFSLYELT
jgi:hypothetical protein